jgi:CheY-like chemotaxis protein
MPQARALIIDNDASNLLVLQQLLSLEDVQAVQLASAANLARELDALGPVDLVFLDLEMPKVNGYDALSIIRAHRHTAAARVIAYSVHVSELNTAMHNGFDGFLGKPLDADAFPTQLARILRGEKVHYIP